MNIVLFGAPGSGKGTQAERLQGELGLPHVASGDLFREHLNRRTELGLEAEKHMNRGQLVPDDITIEMLGGRLRSPDVERGVILDGFPRTLRQAEALAGMMAELDRRIDVVLHIVVSETELVERLSARLMCRQCPASFHKRFNPFRNCPENRCNGEFLYQRKDDQPETVRARLETFRKLTAPLVDYYRNLNLLVTVPGEGTVEEVTRACLDAIARIARQTETAPKR